MSKFFRSSSSSTNSSSSDDDSTRQANSTDDSTQAGARDDAIEDISTALRNIAPGRTTADNGVHSQMLLHALLEERCMNEARNEHMTRGDSPRFDETAIRAAAKTKYHHLCATLAPHNLISTDLGMQIDGLAPARQRYRDGLNLLSRSVKPSAREPVRVPAPFRRLLTHADASSVVEGRSQLPLLSRIHSEASSVMDSLAPAHPMLEPSRYQRDFDEIGILGKGGFGVVYHVRNRLDGLEYAVKKVPISPARMARIRDRGQQEFDELLIELRTLARLEHPNVVRYYAGWIEWINVTISSPRAGRALPGVAAMADSLRGATETDDAILGATDDQSLRRIATESESITGDVVFESSLPNSRKMLPSSSRGELSWPASASAAPVTISSTSSISGTVGCESAQDAPRSASGPSLALHLQMGLYPMTMADLLVPSPAQYQGTHLVPRLQHVADQGLDTQQNFASKVSAAVSRPLQGISHSTHAPQDCTTQTSEDGTASDTTITPFVHCFHLQPSIDIILALIDGVEYLHNEGIVHRDLKPANIFVAANDNPKSAIGLVKKLCSECHTAGRVHPRSLKVRIGDFGLVTALAQPGTSKRGSDTGIGTEVYRPLKRPDHNQHLDIYALGIITFELLYKFDTGMERHDVLHDLKHGGVFPDRFNRDIDRGGHLRKCIRNMLSHDPEVTLRSLRKDLLAVVEST